MKCMERNKQVFYYSLLEGVEDRIDEFGNPTGEHKSTYGKPTKYKANISAAKGETNTRQFGESEAYDKVIVMDRNCPDIDEYSVLWVDTLPVINDDGTTDTPHDYIVKKVAKSINNVSLAIRKVTVSE